MAATKINEASLSNEKRRMSTKRGSFEVHGHRIVVKDTGMTHHVFPVNFRFLKAPTRFKVISATSLLSVNMIRVNKPHHDVV